MTISHRSLIDTTTLIRQHPLTILRGWLTRRRDERTLQSLPDHLLRDMGLSRCEVSFQVRHGRTWK